ncbi:chorismate mutase [Phellopilus nigrolimitatus]|nr:chorismate mutase [Phellopilus nigrolimitatus]
MQQNFLSGDPLSLERIRSTLVRLEDTIIFALIERAQFAHNSRIYERGAMPELRALGFEGSWLDWFLRETESFHAKARRFSSPDEYPFTPESELPKPVLPPLDFPPILHPNDINVNASIQSLYVRSIVPRITAHAAAARRAPDVAGADDGNYGSAATLDVEVLAALSKRVHYGKFVSESKFRAAPAAFVPHIVTPDREALAALITKPEVERRLLHRVREKARLYGQDVGSEGAGAPGSELGGKIDVEGVVELYEHYIIPLTKEVEVDYLLKRLDGLSQEQIDALSKTKQGEK